MKIIHIILASSVPFSATQANTWDVLQDFSVANNPNGTWSYGYYSLYGAIGFDLPSEPTEFSSLTSSQTGANYSSWFTPSEVSVLNITKLNDKNILTLTAGLAPLTTFYAPVVRWTAPADGKYVVRAEFSYSGLGAATSGFSQAGLRANDTTLTYGYIGGSDGFLHFDGSINLISGKHLDFFVARGQHSLGLSSKILAVPEPGTYLLLIVGLATIHKRLLTIRSTGPIAACG